MLIEKTECEGVLKILCHNAKDYRGEFVKVYNESIYKKAGLNVEIRETYYSYSKKNVIRGMHFQLPPYEHAKIVHVINGSVKDVLIDLRKNSNTYGKAFEFELDANNPIGLYIPIGFAHGFRSLEDDTLMLYQVTSEYNQQCDSGILYSSIDYDWGIQTPIISERDKSFGDIKHFCSPF